MEAQVERLVEKTWRKFQQTPKDQRVLIGIGGTPGSGKTTLARIVVDRLNERALQADPDSPPPATSAPLDGFHLTRAALSAMDDPDTAHARRGAAFTFDAAKFLSLVQSLRDFSGPDSQPVSAPSFDHAVKDPKEDDIVILPTQRLVVLEGLYLALNRNLWRDAAALFDERWFLEVDLEVARKRLRERHVKAGIAKDLEEGDRRARESDLLNAEEIMDFRLEVDEVIQSREDETWVQ